MQSVICQRCHKRPATAHLTELSPVGVCTELHICATCIQQLELRLESGPPLIASILASGTAPSLPEIPVSESTSAGKGLTCEVCGLSFADFESGRRFGCAHDYQLWEVELLSLLSGYHGADRHAGRRPGLLEPTFPLDPRLKLDAALRAAVAEEDFATAARLRDELKRLEGSAS